MKRFFGILVLSSMLPFLSFGQAYTFSKRPGTEEWEALSSYEERIKVCQVPTSVMTAMSDIDLIETCLNHPYAINILLFSTLEEGFQSLVKSFNVFAELTYRPQAKVYGKTLLEQMPQTDMSKESLPFIIRKSILQAWLKEYPTQTKALSAVTVLTPKGSVVSDTEKITDTDYTATQKQEIANEVLRTYPGVSIVGPATITYNCHAYAWHVSEGGSAVWMGVSTNPTSIYWTDGSYSSTTCRDNGLKVSYAGKANHSAITTESTGVFISKWGQGPLVRHSFDNCPYYSLTTGLSYYIRNYPSQSYIEGKFAQNSQWKTLNTVNMVDRTAPITLNVDYPNAYKVTWEKTSGGSDVQFGPQTADGKVAGLTMNSSQSVSLKATAYFPCGTVSTEFYFVSTR